MTRNQLAQTAAVAEIAPIGAQAKALRTTRDVGRPMRWLQMEQRSALRRVRGGSRFTLPGLARKQLQVSDIAISGKLSQTKSAIGDC